MKKFISKLMTMRGGTILVALALIMNAHEKVSHALVNSWAICPYVNNRGVMV